MNSPFGGIGARRGGRSGASPWRTRERSAASEWSGPEWTRKALLPECPSPPRRILSKENLELPSNPEDYFTKPFRTDRVAPIQSRTPATPGCRSIPRASPGPLRRPPPPTHTPREPARATYSPSSSPGADGPAVPPSEFRDDRDYSRNTVSLTVLRPGPSGDCNPRRKHGTPFPRRSSELPVESRR